MATIKDQAIVLKRLDYSETSQVLAFLTREHGVQRLIAKGIRRSTKTRFTPGIDLLERGESVFVASSRREGGLGTLTEWRQSDPHLGLRRSLPGWYAAQYAAEIVAATLEEADPHAALFDALGRVLARLAQDGPLFELLAEFQSLLLDQIGLWPNLTRCVKCDRAAPPGRSAYVSTQEGGLICRRCRPQVGPVQLAHGPTLTALRQGRYDVHTAEAAAALLDDMICGTIGRPTTFHLVRKAGRAAYRDRASRAGGDADAPNQRSEER